MAATRSAARPWPPGTPSFTPIHQEPTMALALGNPAPDFTLKSSKMEDVSLSAQRGKNVLLLFIPLAFTPT
jgi:peroxiredoxin